MKRFENERLRHERMTRRELIRRGGFAAAAVTLSPNLLRAAAPLTAEQASPEISPAMQQLSAYMSAAATRALPDDVVEKAKQHILDTFAAMISGSEPPPGHGALEFARGYGGKEIATVVASNIACGPVEAAFAKASKNSKLIALEGAGHFDLIDPRSKVWPTIQKTILDWQF